MKKIALTFLATGALLIPAAPAMAGTQGDHPTHANGPKTEKAPKGKAKGKAKAKAKARAYGKYCQGQSKKHVKGTKGTDFSRCVNAMAKADRNESKSARRACKALSKKHVKGEKGTPFSRCVVGVAQMRKDD